jgi:hypothetical protein
MSGVTLDATFPDDGQPYHLADENMFDDVANLPELIEWLQPDADKVTLSTGNLIASISGRMGSGSLNQGDANLAPKLEASAISGQPGVRFDNTGGQIDALSYSGADLDTDSDFTILALFNFSTAPAPGSQSFVLSRGTTVGNRLRVHGIFDAGLGSPIIRVSRTDDPVFIDSGAIETGKWYLAFFGYNSVEQLIKLRVNGIDLGSAADTGVTSGGMGSPIVLGALNPALGTQPFFGLMSDIMLFQRDLFASPNDIALIEQYMATVYPGAI